MSPEAQHRLPRTVIPRRYDLELEPDLVSFTFRGTEVVTVDVVDPVSEVVLNSVDLEIQGVALLDDSGSVVQSARVTYQPEVERAVLSFESPLDAGPQRISMAFTGTLNDRLHGFYRSTYLDDTGEERVLATTQFEATDARRAFPCWDEPDLKAVFGVTLVVPDGLAAVSCGSVVAETAQAPDKRRVVFADTMPLSTYLLAFIVGDLEATSPVDVDGTPLRVYHTPGNGHLTGFALEAGAHALRYFTDYYGIPYAGGKLDMVAVPDFSAGAMENLGAITYRETALLVDPELATQAELERVASVVAHEIAHMWFGDLVTMRWWNGTWLKEAFATFMEMKCTDAFRPAWKTWLAFGPTRDTAMEIDALATTRSIECPVHSPEDADAMFDTITYEKGSAVLRMLEQYLGEETFRRGIAAYLERHAYGNTETSDLWAALEEASGEPVRAIADDWIFQGGFPQVHVEPIAGGVRLRRECFRYIGDAPHEWQVPVRYRAGDADQRVLVGDATVIETDEPVIVNAGGSGFYRTRYAPPLLSSIATRVGDLQPEERFALIADTWANVLSGDMAAADYLELIGRLRSETEPAVWQAALAGLDELDRIASSDDRRALHDLASGLVADAAAELGWQPAPGETDLTRRLRGLLLSTMGTLADDRATQEEAAAVMDQWFSDPATVDGDVADAALHVVAANGGRDEYERFMAARKVAASPQDEVRLLRAATAVPDTATALELLQMVIDGDLRRQDSYWVVARLLGHRETGAAVWREVRNRWNDILDAMPPQNARLMLNLIHYRSEPDVADDIEGWLSTHPIKGSELLVAQQLERLEVRVGLRDREAPRLAETLARHLAT